MQIQTILGILMVIIGIAMIVVAIIYYMKNRHAKVPVWVWVVGGIGVAALLIGGGLTIWGLMGSSSPEVPPRQNISSQPQYY
jgi:multisubunit Na+/H+ antiporter MnhB subunit